MAELVTVTLVCDNEDAHPEQPVQGETHHVVIDGDPIDIETCPICKVTLLDRIRELGRPVNGRKRTPPRGEVPTATPVRELTPVPDVAPSKGAKDKGGPNRRSAPGDTEYPCLWCDHEPLKTNTGIGLHVNSVHGLSKSVTELYELTCPLCGEESTYKLGIHMMTKHGGLTVPEAFKLARSEGDQYGVVARILSKAAR